MPTPNQTNAIALQARAEARNLLRWAALAAWPVVCLLLAPTLRGILVLMVFTAPFVLPVIWPMRR